MDIMELCRACLSRDGELLQFDDMCFKNYNSLTNLAASREDHLPQYLCQKCWEKMDLFIIFRTQCIASESSLQTILNNVCSCDDIKPEESAYVEVVFKNEELDAAIRQHTSKIIGALEIKAEPEDDVKTELRGDDNAELRDGSNEDNIELQVDENDDNFFGNPYIKDTVAQVKSQNTEDPKATRKVIERKKIKYIKRKSKLRPGTEPKKKRRGRFVRDENDLNKPMDCGLCLKSYLTRDGLCRHVDKHKRDTICSICQQSFTNWPRLLAHRINHLSSGHKRCHICWKVFIKDYTVEYHYYMAHYDGEFPGLQCNICFNNYSSAKRLSNHIHSQHSARKFVCDYCSKVYTNKQHIKIHLRNHSGEQVKEYMCELCDFSCKFHTNMATHKLRKHSKERFYCPQCTRVFLNQQKMDAHKCQAPIICAECGKSFKTKGRYMKHSVVHTGIRKYKCERCPATFRYKQNLRTHIERHEGNRKEKCEFCDAKFYTRNVLTKHRRIHTGERPYVCKICDKGFTASYNLKVHMKSHGHAAHTKAEST